MTPLSAMAWRGRRGLAECLLHGLALLRRGRHHGREPKPSKSHLADLFDPLLKSPTLPVLDRQLLLWLRTLQEAINGAPAHQIALSELEIPMCFAGNAIPLPGYGALVDDAAEGLFVTSECAVQEIRWNAGAVHVKTTRGPFQGDVAVVTFPLAVLRSRDLVFEPPLPARKRRALDAIGYGGRAVLNKVAVRFVEPVCPPSWERLARLPVFGEAGVSFALWTNLHPVSRAPVLVGYTSGDSAAGMDLNGSEKEMLQQALLSLRAMFHKNLPDANAWKASRWISDPWSRGSYSFDKSDSTPADRLSLFQPVADRIFFAGEATHPKHYGTVHGALLSGERVANAIHELYCCKARNRAGAPWNV